MHRHTAIRWVAYARRDWAEYLAARAEDDARKSREVTLPDHAERTSPQYAYYRSPRSVDSLHAGHRSSAPDPAMAVQCSAVQCSAVQRQDPSGSTHPGRARAIDYWSAPASGSDGGQDGAQALVLADDAVRGARADDAPVPLGEFGDAQTLAGAQGGGAEGL
jgi:hypothetical protein